MWATEFYSDGDGKSLANGARWHVFARRLVCINGCWDVVVFPGEATDPDACTLGATRSCTHHLFFIPAGFKSVQDLGTAPSWRLSVGELD